MFSIRFPSCKLGTRPAMKHKRNDVNKKSHGLPYSQKSFSFYKSNFREKCKRLDLSNVSSIAF